MAYQTLALMLGYKCNARCRCCLWGDQLGRRETIDVEEAKQWIDEARQIADVQLLGFSGGESFLYRREMLDLATYAWQKHQLQTAASTNCFWASTKQRALSILTPLAETGLRQLLLSADDFHQEHVPVGRVKNALAAARELGIVATVQCIVTNTSRKLADIREDLGIEQDSELVHASEIFCTRIGWAASRIPPEEFPAREKALSEYCSMLRPLIITPEGDVYLCCGPAFAIPELRAGNLRQERLKEIVERAEWNPLFAALALGNGPVHLVSHLSGNTWSPLADGTYSSSCEACFKILTTPGAATFLSGQLEPEQAQLFLKRIILEQESAEDLLAMMRF